MTGFGLFLLERIHKQQHNSKTEFENTDTSLTVYLGFASQPLMKLSKDFSKRCLNEV